MYLVSKRSALLVSIVLASSSAVAATDPTTIGCPTGWTPATLLLNALAEGQNDCPLLDDPKLLKLVNKFGVGTTFAYPAIPGTCLSGTVSDGTLEIKGEPTIHIDIDAASYSQSAQRLFPVPNGQGYPIGTGSPNLFAWSTDWDIQNELPPSLQAGAAMTVVHLEGTKNTGGMVELDLVLDDHFLVSGLTGADTEDFNVVGSKGDYKVSGRLTGNGQIILDPSLLIVDFAISGTVCLQ